MLLLSPTLPSNLRNNGPTTDLSSPTRVLHYIVRRADRIRHVASVLRDPTAVRDAAVLALVPTEPRSRAVLVVDARLAARRSVFVGCRAGVVVGLVVGQVHRRATVDQVRGRAFGGVGRGGGCGSGGDGGGAPAFGGDGAGTGGGSRQAVVVFGGGDGGGIYGFGLDGGREDCGSHAVGRGGRLGCGAGVDVGCSGVGQAGWAER